MPDRDTRYWKIWKALLFADLILGGALLALLVAFSSLHAPDSSGARGVLLHFPLAVGVTMALSARLAHQQRLRMAIVLMALALPLSLGYLYALASWQGN